MCVCTVQCARIYMGAVFVFAAWDALSQNNENEKSTLHVLMCTRQLKGCQGCSCSCSNSVMEVMSSNKASVSSDHEGDCLMMQAQEPVCFALYNRQDMPAQQGLYLCHKTDLSSNSQKALCFKNGCFPLTHIIQHTKFYPNFLL